jgi:phage terminase large subunit-like protein
VATKTTTRSRASGPDLPPPEELDRLKLSPEVAWYLLDRGFALPDCPPKWKTPEPRDVPGARFDPGKVDRVLRAFYGLRHTQGQWAGKQLRPDPWQIAYIIAPVFGWVRWDDDANDYVRIINVCYVDVPRKQGKSTIAGGIAIYMTCADGEQGAQTITAATTESQAGFVFGPLKLLAAKSPALARHVKAHQKRIVHTASGSYVEVVSSAADAQHGANIHCGIVDELHIHKSPELVETIETGTGSRTQPLIVFITTADSGKPNTIYARKRERVESLAVGTLVDETTYGVIWACDRDDDPHAEETWRKANPGYGISPTRAYLRRKSNEAKQSPAELAAFLRLHLGLRTKQVARFLTLEEWDRNASMVVETNLRGHQAYGGLDLGSTSDLTSLCWLFPDIHGGYDAMWRYWAPEASLPDLNRRTAGSAAVWVRRGWLVPTPGNVTDYEYVKARVIADLDAFNVTELAYDPWNATTLTNDLLGHGAPMIEVRQGYASMSPPLKEVKRLLVEGTIEDPKLRHGGNPVSRWMLDNLTVAMNPAGDVKPDKGNAADKIDGMSAMVTAMARAMHHRPARVSAYDAEHGLEVV